MAVALANDHVRYGSLADMAARRRHVRFIRDSGHLLAQMGSREKCHKRTFDLEICLGRCRWSIGGQMAKPPIRIECD
jgi:hypothetical protein